MQGHHRSGEHLSAAVYQLDAPTAEVSAARSASLKSGFDLVVACALIALALPLMLLVALAIKWDSQGPIFYRQERVGLGGRRFQVLKFRSMRQDAEANGQPVWAEVDDHRITRVGRFIRWARIDELPQLFNVLRGEMSMVGPRPERPFFVERFESMVPSYGKRHQVKPGITGLAQVCGSYHTDARDKLRFDLIYVSHRSVWLDVKILLRTILVIVFPKAAQTKQSS